MPRDFTLKSEWLTRKELIDPKLEAAGWRVVPFALNRPLKAYDRCAIEEYPTDNGPADYALCLGGRIVGVVEAKKLTLGPQNVLTQAERYSKGVAKGAFDYHGYRIPFLYSTNGEVIWHHDIRHVLNRSRIARFHTSEGLDEILNRDVEGALRHLHALPNNNARLRPYQREANDGIEKALSERKRAMLVAMATGTGKTFLSKRTDTGEAGRFRKFGLNEIKKRDYKLDITWLKDESLEENGDLPEPQDLAAEAITELEAVVDDLREIVALVEKEEGVEK